MGPFLKCFDILCLEQYINDKQSNMSKELSDTDSVKSEPDNSVYCVNNVHNENNTDTNCKGKSEHHTNHMHDNKDNSLKSTSYKTLGHPSTSKSTSQIS